ncbi:MAG: hypothetical protein GY870_09855 [archaeon]|nr:hypothetical protein [archaeon]
MLKKEIFSPVNVIQRSSDGGKENITPTMHRVSKLCLTRRRPHRAREIPRYENER